jgi:hypothetical protein
LRYILAFLYQYESDVNMTAVERLAWIQVKIERAKEHITNLDNVIRDFLDSKPYQVSTKRDASRRLVYYLSFVQPTPINIATIAGDVIQNLRSALDHLAWQLFLIGTGGTTTNYHVYFPIAYDDATTYNSALRRTRGMRADAITTFNAIQPYRGGKDEKLWVLNKLNNIDKHRLLITVGSAFQSLNLGAYMCNQMRNNEFGIPVPKVDAYFKPTDNLFPLERGKELFTDVVDAQVNEWLDFRFNIVFNEVGVLEGAPLLYMLNDFCDVVNKAVSLFTPCLT